MGDSKCWWARSLSDNGAAFRAEFDTFLGKEEAWWATPERRVDELITAIQPNRESEFRRQAIVDYITKLIQSCVNCQVGRFGSVPLKTYLPDGDIDLTAVSPSLEAEKTWVDDVHDVLQKEINNPKSEFRITQVQRIAVAEVKLIKIYVGKLLVDVSFSQLGGVRTLCFLEEVDRLIGENHLFKRSIILVKAWCYYESRLLGANCNLMSTYALETLVLYIFHLFHASLRGPLQVLYLFLEFFSSFDWDKYCVSLSGPVSYSKDTKSPAVNFQSLAEGEGGKLLFTKDFLDACERNYGSMGVKEDSKITEFPVKSLNIFDPLRRTNNLGRSVNQGNCARIRRAFVHGARTLRGILQGSVADVCSALDQFFKNCNERFDGSTPWPDGAISRSWPVTRISNGVQRMGGGRRTDNARTVSSEDAVPNGSVPENGDYSTQPRPNPNGLRFDPRNPTNRETSEVDLDNGLEYQGGGIVSPCAVDSAPMRAENLNNSAGYLTSFDKKVEALTLGDKLAMNGPNGDHAAHDSRHIDEEPTRGDGPLSYGESEVSPGRFSERISSSNNQMKEQESSARNVGGAKVSKQFSTTFGSQHSRVSSASPRSGSESEEEEEPSSQSSSSKENFESSRHCSSSELPGRPPDPQCSPLDVSGAETEVQTPQSNDFGSGSGHVKRKRGPGKEKRHGRAAGIAAQDRGRGSSSGATAHSRPQSSGLASGSQNPPRHASTDNAAPGTVEPVPNEAVDSRSHKRQSKVSDQALPQVAVGIVESLEAAGVAASTSSRRNQTAVAARNRTHGAGVPSGIVNSDFLCGDLNLHLEFLAYGRRCEDYCSSSPQLPIVHPACGGEQHSHMHGSCEGPGRPAQFVGHPALNSSGPVLFSPTQIQQQPGHYPQLQPSLGRQVVEVSSRPRGTGTYLPNS